MAKCASGPQGASWPGLACWIRDTDSAEVERLLKQGTQGFKDFWAGYKEKYDGKKEYPQVTRDRAAPPGCAPGYTGYFNSAADGNDLMRDVIKYGEMVQSVYDTLETKDTDSQFFGNKWKDVMVPGDTLSKYDDKGIIMLKSDEGRQYQVVSIIEADSGGYKLIRKDKRNYVGYIAEGPPDANGGVDIAVVFRGTITTGEWWQDIKALQVRWNNGRPLCDSPRPHRHGVAFNFSWKSFNLTILALKLGLLVQSLLRSATRAISAGKPADMAAGRSAAGHGRAAHQLQRAGGGSYGALAGRSQDPSKQDYWVWTILQWLWWFLINMVKTVLDGKDAHISFGFKEMYADAQAPLRSKDRVLASPRLTVMTTLATLLEKYQSPVDGQERHIKSITVTGHSLGGALASLCAWDIGTTFNAACTEPIGRKASDSKLRKLTPVPGNAVESGAVAVAIEDPRPTGLYDQTDQQRDKVMEAVKQLQMNNAPLPAVAAVTFAAPRVGNTTYMRGFQLAGFKTGMLRVVDAADIVPHLPLKLPVPRLCWYVHGGQKLQVDYNDVPYFERFFFGGLQGVCARHNQEMHLHLLDPTRDIALANRTERVLVKGQKVPGCWWSPVPNRSMIEEDGKESSTDRRVWVKAGSPCQALDWYNAKARQEDGHTNSKGNTPLPKVHEAAPGMANVH